MICQALYSVVQQELTLFIIITIVSLDGCDETPHRIHRTHRSLITFWGGLCLFASPQTPPRLGPAELLK